jgi:hypothetical protein
MRKVVSSDQVCHLWAHQTQPEARNANGSLYFSGATIYSYGNHFPIARHVENKKGERAILFTTRDYSVTTSKHKSEVRSAIPRDATVFRVEHPEKAPLVQDLREMETQAAALVLKSRRVRTSKDSYLVSAQDKLTQAVAIAKFFGIKYTPKDSSALDGMADEIKKAREVEAERKRQVEKERTQKALDDIKAWKRGELSYFGHYLDCHYARIDGSEVETTRGAKVPLAHAKRAWPLLKRIIEAGDTYQHNGHSIRLGEYTVNSIDAQGTLIIGCHKFQRDEVLRIGALIESAPEVAYQPKTGQPCTCRQGIERDNCPQCEGTGTVIDFAAIRAAR